MKIYLIRHARQASRLCNVNVSLDPLGLWQSSLLGKRLSGAGIQIVYSSDLIRAAETAKEANVWWKAAYEVRPELREISFVDMEGLSDEEIEKRYGKLKEEQRCMEKDIPYPGGECAGDVIKRVLPFFDELKHSGYETVAVVTHGGVIRSMTAWVLGMDPAKYRLLGKDLENCSITELAYDRKYDRFRLERFNDHAHLEPFPELLRENWK